jgi:cytochrome bd-type quinol oxidase subunit 1
MTFPIVIKVVAPNDARGWIGLGCWLLVLAVLGMIVFERKLLENDAFLILATAIVITGWVQGPVGWAYQATKGGGEAAESTARIAEEAATAAIKTAKP